MDGIFALETFTEGGLWGRGGFSGLRYFGLLLFCVWEMLRVSHCCVGRIRQILLFLAKIRKWIIAYRCDIIYQVMKLLSDWFNEINGFYKI